jgi:ubiquinone/menaquinone biosynthesis C-methylase UbiE
MRFDAYPYGRVASFYDELAGFYSRGRIERSKRHFLNVLAPGDRALFVGVGRGSEAIEAAAAGVRVTAIDLSSAMLARFERALEARGLDATTIQGDVAIHCPDTPYDAVVAHYFLNLYRLDVAEVMLRRLCEMLKPDGRLLLADFARPEQGAWSRWTTTVYYRTANAIAWALGFCALHGIPDYEVLLPRAGLGIESRARFPVFGSDGPAYVAIVARRLGLQGAVSRAAAVSASGAEGP